MENTFFIKSMQNVAYYDVSIDSIARLVGEAWMKLPQKPKQWHSRSEILYWRPSTHLLFAVLYLRFLTVGLYQKRHNKNVPRKYLKGKTWHIRWFSNARQAIATPQWQVSTVDSFSLTTRLWCSTVLKFYFQTVVGRALLVTCSQDVNMLWWWSYTGPYPGLKDLGGPKYIFWGKMITFIIILIKHVMGTTKFGG